MKTLKILLICMFLMVNLSFAQDAHVMRHPDEIEIDNLEWNVPEAERFEFDNGLVVYLQKSTELPIVALKATLRAANIHDPADKLGLALVTGDVVMNGGIQTPERELSGDEVDEEKEFLAIRDYVWTRDEYTEFGFNFLAKDADTALQLFHDMLVYPKMEAHKMEIEKHRYIEQVRRRNDDPMRIAWREFDQAVYGEDSPWARTFDIETISNITHDDVIAFHDTYYKPNNTIITIYGDFEMDEMKSRLQTLFSDWEQEAIDVPEIPKIEREFEPGVYLVEKELNQSTVVMGHYGIRRDNPDYFPVLVMNEILGGGFGSRMFTEVRSNRGLAYATYSRLNEGTDYGTFWAFCSTKSSTTVQAINVMRDVIESMIEEMPSDEEMQNAKDGILNSFVFKFNDTGELVNRLGRLEFYDRDRSFYDNYTENVSKVTKSDVQRVAEKYLHPDALKIVVVGNPEQFDKPLSTIGDVEKIELETFEPPTPEGQE